MDQQRNSFSAQKPLGFPSPIQPIRRNADVERLALPHHLHERANGFLERNIQCRTMGIEDIDIIDTHSHQALFERCQQVLAGSARPIRTRPHVPTGFRGDDHLIPVARKVPFEDQSEILFRRPVGRTIVVGKVVMSDSPVKGTPDHRATGLEDVLTTEILP